MSLLSLFRRKNKPLGSELTLLNLHPAPFEPDEEESQRMCSNPPEGTAFYEHNQDVIESQREVIGRLEAANYQLTFLLSQCPIIELPLDYGQDRMRSSSVAYAYINPETFTKTSDILIDPDVPWYRFPPSPTKWIRTALVPKGCVIFSPNLMPGVQL